MQTGNTIEKITHSAEETYALGMELAAKAMPGECYALNGDLGTGKTVFTKGFARGLGITEHVTSPTFTILQTYEGGRLILHHMDVYRIEDEDEMEEVGLDDCLYGGGVCLIEWPERIKGLLPPDTVSITIEKIRDAGPDDRKITITGDKTFS